MESYPLVHQGSPSLPQASSVGFSQPAHPLPWWLKCKSSAMQKFSSVPQLCLTLCDPIPMNCSMPGFPVVHQLLELAQTRVHSVGDAIQPSHPLLSPSPPAFNLSQHQGFPLSQFFTSGDSLAAFSTCMKQKYREKVTLKPDMTYYILVYVTASSKKQESSRKTSISALLAMPKPLTMCITINCEKF